MTSGTQPETCPLCHEGTLVREEPRSDGSIKCFSCNHASHAAHVSKGVRVELSGHTSLRQSLGPRGAETIAHHHGVGGDAVIVSMQQEMYKDAIYFLRNARSAHAASGDPFVVWRSLRAAILFSFAAIESCMNQFIDTFVDENKTALSQKMIDYWTEKSGFVSVNKKLNEGLELFGGTRLKSDSEGDKELWQEYMELKGLRDSLVHFKTADRVFYNTDELLKRAEVGLRTASAVIKRIYRARSANAVYPAAFDELP